jgi:hypothetical protein
MRRITPGLPLASAAARKSLLWKSKKDERDMTQIIGNGFEIQARANRDNVESCWNQKGR